MWERAYVGAGLCGSGRGRAGGFCTLKLFAGKPAPTGIAGSKLEIGENRPHKKRPKTLS